MKTLFLTIALTLTLVASAGAAPGDLDPTFGSAGTTRVGFGAGDDFGNAMVALGGGKYLVAGSTEDNGYGAIVLVRYLSNGSPDATFGVGGVARLSPSLTASAGASALTVMSDGRILVAGTSGGQPMVARFLSNGAPDTSFGSNGILTLTGLQVHVLCGIAQQGTKIVLCTSFVVGSAYHVGLARIDENGVLDVTFDGDGIARFPVLQESFATGMTIQPDGKFVIVGYAKDASLHRAVALVRCSATGVLDATFDGDGIVTTFAGSGDSYGWAVAVQGTSANKLVVAGDYGPAAGPRNALIIRYNNNGSLDPTFGPAAGTGIIIQPVGAGDDSFRSVTVRYSTRGSADRVVAAGFTRSSNSGNIADILVCQYLITGALDTAIDGDGIILTAVTPQDDRGNSVLVGSGRIVVAGFCGFGGTAPDLLLMAYLSSNGALDSSLDGDGIKTLDLGNVSAGASAVALQGDGKLVLVGTVNDNPGVLAVARLNADGSLDPGFSGDGRLLIPSTLGGSKETTSHDVQLQSDGKILVAGTRGAYPGYSLFVARLLPDGSLDSGFSVGGQFGSIYSEEGYGVAVQPDGAILLVGNSVGSTTYLRVTRLTPAGQADNSFGTFGVFQTLAGGMHAVARDILILPDGRLIVAGYVIPTGNLPAQILLLRLTTAGALDPTFGTGGVTTVDVGPLSDLALAVARQTDGRLVVCGQTRKTSTTSDACVLRFDGEGHLDPTFSGGGIFVRGGGTRSEAFNGLALQPDGRLLLAGGSTNDGATISDQLVMRLNPDGAPDPSFGDGGSLVMDSGSPGDAAADIVPLADGRIVVAGTHAYLMSASLLEGDAASAVGDGGDGSSLPRVGLPRPNPTERGTTIAFERLAGVSAVTADVFDAAGRLVRHLPVEPVDDLGRGRVTWDGSGNGGGRVRAGIYFVRLRMGSAAETRRVVIR